MNSPTLLYPIASSHLALLHSLTPSHSTPLTHRQRDRVPGAPQPVCSEGRGLANARHHIRHVDVRRRLADTKRCGTASFGTIIVVIIIGGTGTRARALPCASILCSKLALALLEVVRKEGMKYSTA